MTKQTFQKFILAFILSMTTFASGFCNPQNQPQADHQKYGDGRLEKVHESPYRKRMPCRDFMEIKYTDEMISLQSEAAEGCFSLQLTDIASSQCHYITSLFVGESVSIDLDCGEYEVSATDSNGQTYNCMFHINWGWGYSKSSGWASDKYYVTNSGSSFGKNMQHLYLGGVRSN